MLDTIKHNKLNDSEFTKDFIQGIINATIETNNENTLKQRHLNTLMNLAKSSSLYY